MKAGYLKDVHLQEENISDSISLRKDISLWDVYNSFTGNATVNSHLSAKFIADGQKINEVFTRLAV
ncbi:MAG: hypothetical protein LBT33_05195 [Spirochaetia bacterium]|nr:hypothetical protein [Spirochaetia bacterium]